jgi:membrane protease YdiL (CAAX protease family)
MPEPIGTLLNYSGLILPGMILMLGLLVLIPRNAPQLRIGVYILAFILIRDAMTPARLWSIDGTMRLAFHRDPLVLAGLGLASVSLVWALVRFDRSLRPLLIWSRGSTVRGVVAGFAAGVIIAIPVMLLTGHGWSKFSAPGPYLAGLAVVALFGNLLEEVLFRGYLQGALAQRTTPVRAALLSGVAFAACHVFLATTVTGAGWPVLLFTLCEGLACAFLCMRYGLISAAACHATVIFLVASQMI